MLSQEERVAALRQLLSSSGWKDVLQPAIKLQISLLETQWINGVRAKGHESMSDDVLKGRIWSLSWIMGWEKRLEEMIKRMDEEAEVWAKTEHHDGGVY